MIGNGLRSLVALHASLILEARACEETANRIRKTDHDRSEVMEDEAVERRMQANTLAELLEPHGVHVPDPEQLSLFSDGGGR